MDYITADMAAQSKMTIVRLQGSLDAAERCIAERDALLRAVQDSHDLAVQETAQALEERDVLRFALQSERAKREAAERNAAGRDGVIMVLRDEASCGVKEPDPVHCEMIVEQNERLMCARHREAALRERVRGLEEGLWALAEHSTLGHSDSVMLHIPVYVREIRRAVSLLSPSAATEPAATKERE